MASTVNRNILTKEFFDQLLSWLHPDRAEAGKKYEEIRSTLLRVFAWRGVPNAEDLADETINRVAQKASQIAATYKGDPARYFLGVAKNVMKEQTLAEQSILPLSDLDKEIVRESPDEDLIEAVHLDRMHQALASCLKELSEGNRNLILTYYGREKQAKIDDRRVLAKQLNVTTNSLRVRVHRIRAVLERCIQSKLAKSSKIDGNELP